MKTLSLVFLLTLLAWHAAAQTDKPITNWKTLDQPEDEFSLEVPEAFEFERFRESEDKISARGEFHSDSERFYIFIDTRKDPRQRQYAQEYVSLHKQTAAPIDLAGREAKKAEFEDATGYYHRIIFTHTATRIFTIHSVSRLKGDQTALRFINSFKLYPKIVVGGSAAMPVFAGTPRSSESPTPFEPRTSPAKPRGGGQGSGQGTGSGSGSGIGTGSGAGSGSAQDGPPKDTAPLRITYKQKASYTDFARFYAIQGTVTLRATFLASGRIGSVTTIKTLPFGLTENAIHAAKQMRFEPETVNGVARNTTRPVVFSFNIY